MDMENLVKVCPKIEFKRQSQWVIFRNGSEKFRLGSGRIILRIADFRRAKVKIRYGNPKELPFSFSRSGQS